VIKLLSVDPSNYRDAPTEGIRRILEIFTREPISRDEKLDTALVGVIRMGTTVATNALLERKGEASALLITQGFKDVLEIGYQARPKLFDLAINKPDVLYSEVVEIEERVTVEDSAKDPFPYKIDVSLDPSLQVGKSGDILRVLTPLNIERTRKSLENLYSRGFRTLSICLAHSYTFPDHEKQVQAIALKVGFTHISMSSSLMPMIKLVSRGMSATADAYLTPEIKRYIEGFRQGFKDGLRNTRCEFMQSDGGLVNMTLFSGLKAILSGPAAGVVGYAKTSFSELDQVPVIGFDMGGTSTDVSRYGGKFEHVFETTTAGVTIQSPQLDINTVAAGGGSILFWRNGLFVVGPESAGAHPGPVCYRKGGPLTVTDANLFLGRLLPEHFPAIFGPNEDLPLDYEITKKHFTSLTAQINAEIDGDLKPEDVALGFLNIANEAMCRPIRSLTEGRGYDTQSHRLAVFGGAGGQHACSIASKLGIDTVVIHRYSSILSAYGMALANVVQEAQEPSSLILGKDSSELIDSRFEVLRSKISNALFAQGFASSDIEMQMFLNLRYEGSDTQIMVANPEDGDFKAAFEESHKREFTFLLPNRDIVIDDIRIRGTGKGRTVSSADAFRELKMMEIKPVKEIGKITKSFFSVGGWQNTQVFGLAELQPGTTVAGPAIIIDKTQTIVVVPGSTAVILKQHVILYLSQDKKQVDGNRIIFNNPDPIKLSTFGHSE
jgi:5-oxoprolinase (ATP-hydrolysing)